MTPDERADRRQRFAAWRGRRDAPLLVLASRRGAPIRMAETLRYAWEHVREWPERPVDRVDVMLVGDGLPSPVAARLASLLREYARELTVVVTGMSGSGETLAAFAADQVLMHPMATLTTILPRPDGAGETGVRALVTDLLDAQGDLDAGRRSLLRHADPAVVGDAVHRLRWVRDTLEHLCSLRVRPPSEADVEAAFDVLTRRVQRDDEPLDRRRARQLAALPVAHMTPDIEHLAFDLHGAHESALGLLDPGAPPDLRAAIESEHTLHLLAASADDQTPARWVRHHERPLH